MRMRDWFYNVYLPDQAMNHPNRSKSNPNPSRNPHPDEIRAAREGAGLTQAEAGALVHTSGPSWGNWEAPKGSACHRRMHPATWELFLIKIGKSP